MPFNIFLKFNPGYQFKGEQREENEKAEMACAAAAAAAVGEDDEGEDNQEGEENEEEEEEDLTEEEHKKSLKKIIEPVTEKQTENKIEIDESLFNLEDLAEIRDELDDLEI